MELYAYPQVRNHQQAFAAASKDRLRWTSSDRRLLDHIAQYLLTNKESFLVVGSLTTYPVESTHFHIMRRNSGGFSIGITRFPPRRRRSALETIVP